VGAQEEELYAHEGPLRTSSTYFDKYLEPRWQESGDKIVRLPDSEHAIVEIYIRWLYFGDLPTASKESRDTLRSNDMSLVKAWIFADKVLDNAFHDAVIHAFVKRISTCADDHRYYLFEPDAVKYADQHTMKGASMRHLFVDLYCQSSHEALMPLWEDEDIPFDFVLELAKELAKRTPAPKTLYMSNYLRVDHQD
jgi:hypothetical protein